MDFTSKLSDLLFQDIMDLKDKPPDYVALHRRSAKLIDRLSEKGGEDLVGEMLEVRSEIDHYDLLRCFLYGLQVGSAVSHPG